MYSISMNHLRFSRALSFLMRHNLNINADIRSVVSSLLYDMECALQGHPDAAQNMVPVFMLPPERAVTNRRIIVLDAGGTNFRSCLVTFDAEGSAEISMLQRCAMPALDRELSRKEFFDTIASNISRLKDMADTIAFCFSYGMRITPEHDGVALAFSKEIKAPEVTGCAVGAELRKSLAAQGWKRTDKIVLLNDTQAALLAGAAGTNAGRYSSYVGFILGTGINTAFIQPEREDIAWKSQIVVTEAGKFNKIQRSDFDIALESRSDRPELYVFEKMCSGGYLGSLMLEVLRCASKEGLFSEQTAAALHSLEHLPLMQTDSFMHAPQESELGSLCATQEDAAALFELLDAVLDRAARYATAMISAAVLSTGQGRHPSRPVCVLCNGTTFYKTYRMRERIFSYLHRFLTEEHGIHFELVQKEGDITLGAAIAGASV